MQLKKEKGKKTMKKKEKINELINLMNEKEKKAVKYFQNKKALYFFFEGETDYKNDEMLNKNQQYKAEDERTHLYMPSPSISAYIAYKNCNITHKNVKNWKYNDFIKLKGKFSFTVGWIPYDTPIVNVHTHPEGKIDIINLSLKKRQLNN